MKTSVSVRVLKPFDWNGQSYTEGQSIDLTPIDAVVLAKKHHITLTKRKAVPPPEPPAPPPVEAPPEEPPAPKRGRYRRRDLQAAEESAVMTAEAPAEVTPDVPSVDE